MPAVGLDELAGLARSMTLKFGFWKIPIGGAKACILISNKIPRRKRRQILESFGKNLAPLLKAGIYTPATDMGSSRTDIDNILNAAGCPSFRKESKAHTYTSWTMHASAEAAAAHIGMDISGSTIAIEGFGKIGASAAETFAEAGAKVVAISTIEGAIYDPLGLDVTQILELREQFGDQVIAHYPAQRIAKSELFGLPVDILAPCAGPWSINFSNAKDLKCKIVCPGANIPMSNEVESFLHKRGVLCIPDFIANSGGAFGGHIEPFVNEHRIKEMIHDNFRRQVQELIDYSQDMNAPIGNVAREISEQRFQAMKTKAVTSLLRSEGIKSFIRRMPKSVTNRLAPLYFKRVLNVDERASIVGPSTH